MDRARQSSRMPPLDRAGHRCSAGRGGGRARASRRAALGHAPEHRVGDRGRTALPAPGSANDCAARAGRLDSARAGLLDAHVPPGRVAIGADDATLPRLASGAHRGGLPGRDASRAGTGLPFRHAAINGWYYTAAPATSSIPLALLRALVESRGRVLQVVLNALVRPSTQPEIADRALLRRLAGYWRDQLLPRYEQAVADGEQGLLRRGRRR